MKSIRLGSFRVSFYQDMVIDRIEFAHSGNEASFNDVKKHADFEVSDGENLNVFGFDMTNQSGINAIAFTGGANFVCDFETEQKLIESN